MKTLDELKENWANVSDTSSSRQAYSQPQLEKMFRRRVSKHTRASMQYFWASFILQIIVYALLSHVLVKYWTDSRVRWLSITGILLYVPFTCMLLKMFKQMAAAPLVAGASMEASMQQYAALQYNLLKKFFRFKKWYEYALIPLAAAIGVVLCFWLYVPGGVAAHAAGAVVTFGITLISCALAIRSENKKSFERPLAQLRAILDEFNREA